MCQFETQYNVALYGSPTVPPPIVGFEQTSLSVLETAGDVEVCVVLLSETMIDVTVTVLVNEDTATGIARRD